MKKIIDHKKPALEACILAGGLSTRMGRDKSRLRVGPRTMLGQVRAVAKALEVPVQTIRRDAVSRCGPLGGIYTALKRSRADMVIILACDMPFVSLQFLERMVKALGPRTNALFACEDGLAGFPFVLRREICLPLVWRQIAESEFSLQSLAKALRGKMMIPRRGGEGQLANLNTPSDLEKARQRVHTLPPALFPKLRA